MNSDGSYTLRGAPTGSATNTYPPAITAIAAGSPYTANNGTQSIDCAWLANCYAPNIVDAKNSASLMYLFGNASPVQTYFSVTASASNYAWNSTFGLGSVPAGYPFQGPHPTLYYVVVGASHVKAQVQLNLFFCWNPTWVGAGPPTMPMPAPPPYIDLLLTDNLTSSASISWWNGYVDTGHGRIASVTLTVPSFSEQTAAQASDASVSLRSQAGQTVQGRHLVRATVQGGVAQVYLAGQATANASNPLAYLIQGDDDYWNPQPGDITASTSSAGASLSATVKPDGREVTISCPTIETSFHKGAVDSLHPTGRWVNARASNGSMNGDSAAIYNSDSSASGGVWVANATFTANTPGFTNPSYSWMSDYDSPANVGLNLAGQTVSCSSSFHDSNPLPATKTIQVNVQDGLTPGDHATAANTYSVNWHLPYQPTSFLGSVPRKIQLKQLYGPVHQGDFSDIQTSEARNIDVGEGFDAAGAVVAVTGQEEAAGVLEIIGKLARVSDFKYHYGGDNVHYGTQNGQDKWTATLNNSNWAANITDQNLLNFKDPRTGASDGWVFCDLSIWEVKLYHHMTWAADKYTQHGYDSAGYILYADPVDKIEEEPYYTEISRPPTVPGP